MKKRCCIYFLFLGLKYFASHIVGGEMLYDYIGKDNSGQDLYRLTLKIYRDCKPGTAPFDTPANVIVLESNGVSLGTFDIGIPIITKIPPSINSQCIQTPTDVCVQEGVYTTTLTLPSKTGGYYIIYQRCCRNSSINNLVLPGNQSSTYYTRIPGPEDAVNNSSPRFNNFPPIFLCSNLNFLLDHSATDPDGDHLEYSFYTPFSDNSGPTLPPYLPVNYMTPYGGDYPVASNPSLAINSNNGQLDGRPNLIGQFVVGICVKEYRANKLINIHYRDFQFNIRNCIAEVISEIKEQTKFCEGSTVTFTNMSTGILGSPTALWNFGVTHLSNDTSHLFNPTYTFPDTGKYTVTLIANPHKPCADTSRKDFYIYPKLDVSYFPQPKQCLKNNSFNFNLENPYLAGTTYSWDFTNSASPPVTSLSNPINIVFNEKGLFFVKLTARYFTCRDTFVDLVQIIDAPSAPVINWDTSVVIGQRIPVNAFVGSGFTYTWAPLTDYLNCSTCLAPDLVSHTTNNITYTVLVEDTMHCYITKNTYSIFIEAKASVDVPTAFTPNDDGINDVIYAGGWGIRKLLYFRVYNRWGQLLFESNDLNAGWDGRINGLAQNMETYIYQVSVETYLKEQPVIVRTGSFKLMR